ncbi:MAG: SMP-30/gluconolactonase/LRE family protein [Bacteroidota bacterium]
MKQLSTIAAAITILLAACSKTPILEEQPISPGSSQVANAANQSFPAQDIVFTQQNLFPEGVVYDKFNNRFYVSSTTRGDIGIVTSDGVYTPFITDSALIGTTGLEIDEARKLLYVSNSSNGSVCIYDINTGERVNFIDLKPLSPGANFFINDIAIDPQGNAYVTNSRAPVIYKISGSGIASIFYQDAAFATTGFGFNGIEYGNQDSGYLLVAYSVNNQVIKFPITNPAAYNAVSLNATLAGPDGLMLSKNGRDLIVVNNAGGGNGKVITFTSNNKWATGTAVNTFETGPVFPTTATSTGKIVFVLYAYLNKRAVGQSVFTIKQVPGTEKF